MKLKRHDYVALAIMAVLFVVLTAAPAFSVVQWAAGLVSEVVPDTNRYVNLRPTGDTLYLPLGEYTLWEADSIFTGDQQDWGQTDPSTRRIILERGMAPVFRDTVLGHELCHAKLRDSDVEYDEREERRCDVLGGDLSRARRLERPDG